MDDYVFITYWLVNERAGRLWDLLAEGLHRGDPVPWWGMVETVDHDADSVWMRTRSGLGYQLNFRLFNVTEDRPNRVSFNCDGDLTGTGTIRFSRLGPSCVLIIDWRVTVHKRWMRRSQRFLRPVFIGAHRLVMAVGLRRLKKWVRQNPDHK